MVLELGPPRGTGKMIQFCWTLALQTALIWLVHSDRLDFCHNLHMATQTLQCMCHQEAVAVAELVTKDLIRTSSHPQTQRNHRFVKFHNLSIFSIYMYIIEFIRVTIWKLKSNLIIKDSLIDFIFRYYQDRQNPLCFFKALAFFELTTWYVFEIPRSYPYCNVFSFKKCTLL